MKINQPIGSNLWLVEESARWAIYDLEGRSIIQLTKDGGEALQKLANDSRMAKGKRDMLIDQAPGFCQILKTEGCFNRLFENSSAIIPFHSRYYMLWIELTNVCNQHCLHCYVGSNFCKQNFLNKTILKRFIRQASGLKFEQIQFTGGEPLLYPNIWEIVSYARRLNSRLIIEIYTNLTLLQDKDIKTIKKI